MCDLYSITRTQEAIRRCFEPSAVVVQQKWIPVCVRHTTKQRFRARWRLTARFSLLWTACGSHSVVHTSFIALHRVHVVAPNGVHALVVTSARIAILIGAIDTSAP